MGCAVIGKQSTISCCDVPTTKLVFYSNIMSQTLFFTLVCQRFFFIVYCKNDTLCFLAVYSYSKIY